MNKTLESSQNSARLYVADQTMRSLISDNPMLLAALTRFGISLGFGEATVKEVCDAAGVHTPTFLAVTNYISFGESGNFQVDLTSLIYYLRNAHDYFLNYIAPNLRQLMLQAVSSADIPKLALALMKFFDEYIGEVRRHMTFEENTVFEYVNALKEGNTGLQGFTIDDFSRSHSPIHGKLAELKNLLVCHFTADKGRVDLMNTLLFDIVNFEKDLSTHCRLEDAIFVPAVKKLEQSEAGLSTNVDKTKLEDNGDIALTLREKEIVGCVAKGMSNKEIADQLCLSVHTVATHRRNICAKLDLHSSSALAVYGVLHGL